MWNPIIGKRLIATRSEIIFACEWKRESEWISFEERAIDIADRLIFSSKQKRQYLYFLVWWEATGCGTTGLSQFLVWSTDCCSRSVCYVYVKLYDCFRTYDTEKNGNTFTFFICKKKLMKPLKVIAVNLTHLAYWHCKHQTKLVILWNILKKQL